jgi:hypothetical protein
MTKILKNLYLLSIGFQNNTSTIADVIPGILKIIYSWENMKLPLVGQIFVHSLNLQKKNLIMN